MYEARRQRPWQALNSIGIILGLVFTGGGLYYTALTWQTGQEELRVTQEQQITDRYTRAVEQIGPGRSLEVRAGGVSALARIAKDSAPDAGTIQNVLTAFILEHDRPGRLKGRDRPGTPKGMATWKPGADLNAALRALGDLTRRTTKEFPRLKDASFTGAQWGSVDLAGAYLADAELVQADMMYADLRGADLRSANLNGATLNAADLTGADLRGAQLKYTSLYRANLTGARLTGKVLFPGTDFTDANLTGADLRGAEIGAAVLAGANLSGADLRGVKGMTPDEIRRTTKTDATTKF
ncbi:pentapeptide repeat-containing protein [Spongiactinospora rosea]|nr:pentapeptide repeat-containing protein [Spongiactinospora rosea]